MNQVSAPQTAVFNHAYDWSQIHDRHTYPFALSEGDGEVAQLCRDVAIACNTSLGVVSSNSFFGNDAAGLVNYMRYDPDALFTDSVLKGGPGADPNSLITEIQWGRPAGLGGMASRGGHAWVVYGYNTFLQTQFMMNFGFSGDTDGWYTLDDPYVETDHDMMTRVAPTNVKFVGASVPGDGSPATPYQDLAQASALAPNGTTLIFKAQSVNSFTGLINRPLVLKGINATIH
jgi:hypothetical protein